MLRFLCAVAALLLPAAASADYLYSMFSIERQPHVLLIVDNSAAMATELAGVKTQLNELLPRLDGIQLGIASYSGPLTLGSNLKYTCTAQNNVSGALGLTARSQLGTRISSMSSSGLSSIGTALTAAKAEFVNDAEGDKARNCRPYYVVLVVAGNDPCTNNSDNSKVVDAVKALRDFNVQGKDVDVRTFVVAVGSTATSYSNLWNDIAKEGGTAVDASGSICTSARHAKCGSGNALYAASASDLEGHFRKIFATMLTGEYSGIAPVIDTVPQTQSEVGRVSRNFMTYGTFRMPGSQGHLYGLRLFKESASGSGIWNFTDFTRLNLNDCGGSADNPCVFDAGKRLADRVAANTNARRIFTATAGTAIGSTTGAFTLPLDSTPVELPNSSTGASNFSSAATTFTSRLGTEYSLSSILGSLGLSGGSVDPNAIVAWLHGTNRDWPLGDFYHAGPAVVGPPSYPYKTRGYPDFVTAAHARPAMIYAPANDGMIHAFYASPDFSTTPAWQAGDEAWAYLPVSQLGQVAAAVGKGAQRFFSQDLSCRIDDVLTRNNLDASGNLDCNSDPYCGWRTILLCGQGWGGSWYVAMDVTDPADPKPLWEATYGGTRGLGRTWSLPGIALVNKKGMPTWVAAIGSGYNVDMNCSSGSTCSDSERKAYRILNQPFKGLFPQHGDGTTGDQGQLFLLNMATGEFLKTLSDVSGTIVADTPVLDTDLDGWSDTIFAGTWNSQIDQLSIGHDTSNDLTYAMCKSVRGFSGSSNKAITSRPSALTNPDRRGNVWLFVGAGVDGGTYPDQQLDSGNRFDFSIFDVNASAGTCQSSNSTSTLCTSGTTLNGIFSNGSRLVGSPVLVLREYGERWLTFNSWLPPPVNTPCDAPVTTLHCLDISGGSTCKPCGGTAGESSAISTLTTNGRPPSSPTSADGQLYVITPGGPLRIDNQAGTGSGVSNGSANSTATGITAVVSWREIFD